MPESAGSEARTGRGEKGLFSKKIHLHIVFHIKCIFFTSIIKTLRKAIIYGLTIIYRKAIIVNNGLN